MRRHRFAVVLAIVLLAGGVGLYYYMTYDPHAPRNNWPVLQAAATTNDTARVVVGPNIHVSATLDEFSYWECVLTADPEDPARLFTAVMHWRGKEHVDIAGFYSHDGGETWQLGCDLPAPSGKKFFDPTVAFGPDGSVYLTHMQDELNGAPLGSEEGGDLHFHASPGRAGRRVHEFRPGDRRQPGRGGRCELV